MVERAEKLRFCPYEVPQTCKSEENKRNPPELPAPRAQRSSSFPQTSGLHPRKIKKFILWSARNKGKDILSEITDPSKHKDILIQCTAERKEILKVQIQRQINYQLTHLLAWFEFSSIFF
ncbi:hypothetical protein TB2_038671 [Malus domestica]|nr:uncharacterized protein LOC114825369 [Malus domestica]